MRLAATKDTHIGQRIGARSRIRTLIEQVAGLCCAAADVRPAFADATHRHSRRTSSSPSPTCFSTAITRTLFASPLLTIEFVDGACHRSAMTHQPTLNPPDQSSALPGPTPGTPRGRSYR